MASPLDRLEFARSIRDRSLSLVKSDIEHVRGDLSFRNLKRRARETATDMTEDAVDIADHNPELVAAGAGAVALYLLREPIARMFDRLFGPGSAGGHDVADDLDETDEYYDDDLDGDAEPGAQRGRSRTTS